MPIITFNMVNKVRSLLLQRASIAIETISPIPTG
jgi:hypothetical protein